MEMFLTQLVINLRYALMSLSLSQKVDKSVGLWQRFIVGFGITDEIFAVAMNRNKTVSSSYMYGLIVIPYIGWAMGTAIGALVGTILPVLVGNALGIAIYGMFLAIIIPQARDQFPVLKVIIIAAVFSGCFRWLPGLNRISSGFVIIICAVIASAVGAVLDPISVEDDEAEEPLP